ncbi:MAG: serine hydrolase [Pseudomonadota bacterium]
MNKHHLLVVLLKVCLCNGLSHANEWQSASPAEAGLEPALIQQLVDELEDDSLLPGMHSFLIVKDQKLVVEAYFDGWQADEPHTLQSVSKSVTAALVGIALARGDIKSVDENVLGFYPSTTRFENMDQRKQAMTIEHLLTMQSGTDYHERGRNSPHDQLNRLSRGWDRFYLNRPMETDPGSKFLYDSGAVILMSSLLKQRTGLHADVYAKKHLFEPLRIKPTRWYRNSEGHPHTGGGLYLRPRDMAKFGVLYLQRGKWKGQQIIPAWWVDASSKLQVEFGPENQQPHEIGYGYWWWILEPDPNGNQAQNIYAALGFRGQHIFVVPEHDMVVVTTAGISDSTMHDPIGLLYSRILPALVR